MIKKSLFILFSILIVLTSCNRQPVSSFSIVSTELFLHDTIKCKNESQLSERNEWYIDTILVSNAKDLFHIMYGRISPGNHQIKLICYSKKDKKSNTATKSINVKKDFGTIYFWSNLYTGNPTNILIEFLHSSTYTFRLKQYSHSDPGCASSDETSTGLKEGNYIVRFSNLETGDSYTDTLVIKNNTCFGYKVF